MTKNSLVYNCLIITLLTFTISQSVHSQRIQTRHSIAVWAASGYANMIHDVELALPYGGIGGLMGLGYEFNHGLFILKTGGEFDFKHVQNNLKPFRVEADMYDTEGDEVLFHYQFNRCVERYDIAYANIPVLLGIQFPNLYYFLAGGKFGIHLVGQARINSNLRTYGVYPQFIDPFEEMPDHFYVGSKALKASNPVGLNFNAIASFEFGKVIFPGKRNSRTHYRLAGFADYGLMNLNLNQINGDGNIVRLPISADGSSNVLDVQHNSLFTSNQMQDKTINSLLVGVKFTVLFDVGSELCNCWPEDNYKKKKSRRRRR